MGNANDIPLTLGAQPAEGAAVCVQVDATIGAAPRMVYWGPALNAEPLSPLGEHLSGVATLSLPAGGGLLTAEGQGFFGAPALRGHREGLGWAPALVTAEATTQGSTARLRLTDADGQLEARLQLDLCPTTGVLTQRLSLKNTGADVYELGWAAAAAWPLSGELREVMSFHGAWCQEFQTERLPIPRGQLRRESRKGRPGHDGFPGMVVGEAGFTETQGAVFGASLGFSGNHRLVVERGHDGAAQLMLGELLMPGELRLQPGEVYTSPPAYGCWAPDLRRFSQRMHRFVRAHLPAEVHARPRPVHYNTWEAVYFEHRPEALMSLASAAAEVGAERFVLDDGWFTGRDHDRAALGDWTVDPRKWPDGLGPLIQHVQGLGMEFGLWVEPEMVNPDSALYRAHPDWALGLPGRPLLLGRNQLVLNLARPDVQAYLLDALSALLRRYPIRYLKWDHNRDLAPAADAAGSPAYHGNVRGLYALLDELRRRHPEVELESCASGGARVDLGILARTHRVWTSDSNDALERLSIQQGASYFLPSLILGSHVGPERSHTSGRRLDLLFRAQVAFFGSFGFEMDLRELTAPERALLAELTAAYKRWRQLLHLGDLYRLRPNSPRRQALAVVQPGGQQAVIGLFQREAPGHQDPQRLRLAGLNPDATYRLRPIGPTPVDPDRLPPALAPEGPPISGQALMQSGLHISLPHPATALLLSAEAVPPSASAPSPSPQGLDRPERG